MKVREIGEDALIARLLKKMDGNKGQGESVLVGPGDDCAVTCEEGSNLYRLHKVDSVIEGVHFLPAEDGGRVGWKAVARVLSDFAAMGGRGRHLMIALCCPKETTVAWLEDVYVGASRCAQTFGIDIVGGETSSSTGPVTISVSGIGEVEKENMKLRSTANVGDVLCVTGKLGGSISGKHLDFIPRCVEGEWLGQQTGVTAMMDVSDGVGKDIVRLGKSSFCGFQVCSENLPVVKGCTIEEALYDGEDYELLFTVEEKAYDILEKQFKLKFMDTGLSKIGRCVSSSEGDAFAGGWEHFTK